MTIEIRQLVIRAVVDGHRGPAASEPAVAGPRVRAEATPARSPTRPASEADLLVARCVREVMRELRKWRER